VRSVLKAAGVTGSGALVKLVAGVVSAKAIALLMGPAGISAFAQMQYVLVLATLMGTLGINTSIVREIGNAAVGDDHEQISRIRTTGLFTTWVISGIVAFMIWLLREPIAVYALDNRALTRFVGWIALAVPLSSIATIQIALLNGLRRIKDMAIITIVSNLVGLTVTIALVSMIGEPGLLIGLASTPVSSFSLGRLRVHAAFGRPRSNDLPIRKLVDSQVVRNLVMLGSTVMVTALLAQGTQFGVRIWLLQRFGADANGQFQAAWTISIGYMSLVLYAMAADYYPRLVQAQDNTEQLNLTINQQLKVALLLSMPIAFVMMAFASAAVYLLYSTEFTHTAFILRWQLMGDLLKVLSWAFGFVLLAAGRSVMYFLVELMWNVLFLAGVAVFVPRFGLEAAGTAFFGSYVAYAFITFWLVVRIAKYRVSADVVQILILAVVLCCGIWVAQLIPHSYARHAALVSLVGVGTLYSILMLERDTQLISGIRRRLETQRAVAVASKDQIR
jgi:O-antigen/teichoic acid export membrane protein